MLKGLKKILIFGYFGFGNTGDELILLSLVENLKQKARITVLSANPTKTSNEFKIKTVNRYNIFKIAWEILNTNVLLGAGGLLQDRTSKKSIWYYLTIILTGKIFFKRVVLFSQGVGPINFPFNRWLMRIILNNVDLITLRDKESYREIRKLNIKKVNSLITGDLAFALDFSGIKIEKEKYFKVGIVLRKFKEHEFFVREIKKICGKLNKQKKIKFIFFPFQLPLDNIAAGKIIVKANVKDLIPEIASLNLIIGARYHSLILASMFNIPFIGINYDNKIGNFCRFLKSDCIDLNKKSFNRRLKSSIIKNIKMKVKYDLNSLKQDVSNSFNLI